ncbi:MAG TPA: cobalamin biosynthesis protein, partial [Afifellaceae bacterium]|nr:cobalamin biosynthesis protein [Afifellaceae bacterium]
MEVSAGLAILAAALVLDRLTGDPPWLWSRVPHPVAAIGRLVGWLDRSWNDDAQPEAARRHRGVALAGLLIAGGIVVGIALQLAFAALPLVSALEIAAVAVLLAQGSLIAHVRRVADPLAANDLGGAREAVAAIVGRDVSALD